MQGITFHPFSIVARNTLKARESPLGHPWKSLENLKQTWRWYAMSSKAAPESVAPGLARRLRQGWLELAAHFGEVQTLLIVCVVYLFMIGPTALIATLAGRDLLAKRGFEGSASAWNDADSVSNPDLERAKRLF